MEVVLATAGYDHSIKYWNVVDGVCVHSIQHNESHINRLAISSDKRQLAVAGNPCIRVYDNTSAASPNNNESGSVVQLLEGHRSNVTGVGWQHESRWLWSTSEDGTARIWDLRQPHHKHSMCPREFAAKYALNDGALHPDQSELATVDERGCLRVWKLAGRECLYESVPEADSLPPVALQSVCYAPDGAGIVCCNARGTVFIYGQQNGKYVLLRRIQAHSTHITRIAYSPDGHSLCTCSADGTARLFNGSTLDNKPDRVLMGHSKWVWDCVFSADSAYILTASSDGTARLFERKTGEVMSVFSGHSKALTCIALNDIP